MTCNGKFPLKNVHFALRWGEDIFKRYIFNKEPIEFATKQDLKQYMVKHAPDTINVEFPESARPLVFDVDIQDYSEITRTCQCEAKQVCSICWKQIMRPAMISARQFLCDFCKFEKVLFVFSGGKGFHIWVLDERVWSFSLNARQNFADRMPIQFDRPITCDKGHLIKMPWCIHQKTGRLCQTIDNIELFVP